MWQPGHARIRHASRKMPFKTSLWMLHKSVVRCLSGSPVPLSWGSYSGCPVPCRCFASARHTWVIEVCHCMAMCVLEHFSAFKPGKKTHAWPERSSYQPPYAYRYAHGRFQVQETICTHARAKHLISRSGCLDVMVCPQTPRLAVAACCPPYDTGGKRNIPNISQRFLKNWFWDMPWEMVGNRMGWVGIFGTDLGKWCLGRSPIRCGFWDMVGMSLRKVLGQVCHIFFTLWHFPKTMASVENSQNMEFGKRFGTCMGVFGT
jgi:hypothetical protein